MAEGDEEDKDAKTEEPSRKKLEDAVKKGQVVNSKEVTSFIVFLLLTLITIWVIPEIMLSLSNTLRFFVENAGNIPMDQGMLDILLPTVMKKTLLYLSPIFLVVIIAALVSSYFQSGEFIFTGETIQPKLSKLSIMKGFKRIFSMKSFVEFIKGIFKISLVGAFVLLIILADVKELSQYQELSVAGILDQLMTMVRHILILVTIIMAVIASVDFAYQSYEHYTELKMTKQEVKDEYKQSEGNPEIKQKLRSLRRSQAKKRIKLTVPQATVVITNPEHYAIALKYEAGAGLAPVCVAKGLDLIAQTIKEIAKESSIPIVENPPLARALYKDVKIDEEIPIDHFEEVAKIISYVMSLEEKTKQKKR
ncbi:Flagellar biosynthetic protein FlhB [Candidatus Megaera venefica]|uniref:Flagellar biosynthetic protein FlhB n=1 Tax=Candidatus Megaera venefica TaxID=2055910 RepID=A0ABU5NDG6_9RICK|nr:flagellar biosynthesis protein FlhB [Candidatus Megaera venefica]MEA0971236.1 Flagellar biosynthetic protein FlhB [Candidatus Megaera venefica]